MVGVDSNEISPPLTEGIVKDVGVPRPTVINLLCDRLPLMNKFFVLIPSSEVFVTFLVKFTGP